MYLETKAVIAASIVTLICIGASFAYMIEYEKNNEIVCNEIMNDKYSIISDSYLDCQKFMQDRTIFFWLPFSVLAVFLSILVGCIGGMIAA